MSQLIILLISIVSLPVQALQDTNQRPELAIGTMLGSLLLVLACIFFFAFLMKKSNLIKHGGHKNPIKIIATQSLTNKARVQIVEVSGKQYLLGVSDQSINLLAELEIAVGDRMVDNDVAKTPSLSASFADILSKVGRKKS